jgi:hypothetical protein
MSLTRRLYRLDEVRAALLYSLKSKRLYEAIFWLNELEDSWYSGEARRLLLVSWLMNVGIARLAWLAAWAKGSNTREGRLRLCWQLLKCHEQDSSLWLLLWAGAIDTSGASSFVSSWQHVSMKDDETFWGNLFDNTEDERICSILEALQVDMKTYSLYAKCIGYAVIHSIQHLSSSTWVALSEKEPQDLVSTIQSWNEASTLKEKRVYSIPYDCLFGMTWRGSGADTTLELQNLTLETFWKSAIWKTLIKEYSASPTEWNSDEALEVFWDTEFKGCDIPDEWTKQDQEKSHGCGVTFPDGRLTRWWKNWICSEHLLIWGVSKRCIEKTIETLSGNFGGASVLDKLLQLYKEQQIEIPSVKNLTKKFIFAD